jgi:glutamate-1-semialdehyde 2,1-aminomutase
VSSALAELTAREEERLARERPRSRELADRARPNLLGGVPMHWMVKWPGGFPLSGCAS